MSVRYEIRAFDAGTDKPRAYEIRKRSDAAGIALYNVAREMVASWAGLDTAWGWQFMRKAMAVDVSAPAPGTSRVSQVDMPQHRGGFVEFRAIRGAI